MKKTLILTVITLLCSNLFSQTILIDEKFTNGIPSTWTTIDADGFTPSNNQFNNAWIGYQSAFDTCAASTSYYIDVNGNDDTTAIASDYLITPKVSLLSFGNMLTWSAKSLDGSYPDGYQVLISTTDSLLTSFTTVLKTVTSESPYWTNYTIDLANLGYVNQNVYIAFKNNTKNGFILLIDNIKLTADDPSNINSKNIDIKVFPNPTRDVFTVKTNGFESLKLYNLSGQLVLSSVNKANSLATLPKGFYFLEIKTQNGTLKRKIIKE